MICEYTDMPRSYLLAVSALQMIGDAGHRKPLGKGYQTGGNSA